MTIVQPMLIKCFALHFSSSLYRTSPTIALTKALGSCGNKMWPEHQLSKGESVKKKNHMRGGRNSV